MNTAKRILNAPDVDKEKFGDAPQMIMSQLNYEKQDDLEWSNDPEINELMNDIGELSLALQQKGGLIKKIDSVLVLKDKAAKLEHLLTKQTDGIPTYLRGKDMSFDLSSELIKPRKLNLPYL